MRLFVAVDLSPETRAQLGAVREQIDSLLNGRRAPRITWVKPEVAHLTVQFLGEVADHDVDQVTGALGGHSLADGPFVVSWERSLTRVDRESCGSGRPAVRSRCRHSRVKYANV